MGGASMGVKWTYDTIGELVELKVGDLNLDDTRELVYATAYFLGDVLRHAQEVGNEDMAKFIGVITLMGAHISGLEQSLRDRGNPIYTAHNSSTPDYYRTIAKRAFGEED